MRIKRIQYPVLFPVVLWIFFSASCMTAPKLTAEDRKQDIQFLADWTEDYSPFAGRYEQSKNIPSYQTLLPRYLKFAEHARSNEDFYQVVQGYFEVIGASCHFYPIRGEAFLKWINLGSSLGLIDMDLTPRQYHRSRYWARLSGKIPTRAYPPFPITHKQGQYFVDKDLHISETNVPRGSEIIRVNSQTCSAYLDYIKENTFLRYDAFPKVWVDQHLLIVDEGSTHRGWQVDFRLPDGSDKTVFVPKTKGEPGLGLGWLATNEPKANCTCLELTDDVGYIRIKSCMPGWLSALFRGFIKKDRDKIKSFLDRSQGSYSKLIIDLRNNGGGLAQYGYDVLISPFLDAPVTYSHVVGVKKRFLADTDRSVLEFLRREVSTEKAHVIDMTETMPPEGFQADQWIFYQVTRKIEPAHRYNFHGDIYILINGGCLSATDDALNAIKRIGFATLVGQNTGGGAAAYCMPPILTLPKSGMAFRVETDLVINPDGSINELVGTPPDVELPDILPPRSITKEDLLKDEWVRTVIDEL